MTIYLSGKITGDENWKQKFQAVADELKDKKPDLTILSPLMLDVTLEYEQYMDIDFAFIRSCDVVVLLEDWEDSPGAKREKEYAQALGKMVIPYKLINLES